MTLTESRYGIKHLRAQKTGGFHREHEMQEATLVRPAWPRPTRAFRLPGYPSSRIGRASQLSCLSTSSSTDGGKYPVGQPSAGEASAAVTVSMHGEPDGQPLGNRSSPARPSTRPRSPSSRLVHQDRAASTCVTRGAPRAPTRPFILSQLVLPPEAADPPRSDDFLLA